MKIRDVLRDKSFRLVTCFYVFLAIVIFHLEVFSQSAQVDYGIRVPDNNQWYSEAWIWAVLTAVLILIVAVNGRVEDPARTKRKD